MPYECCGATKLDGEAVLRLLAKELGVPVSTLKGALSELILGLDND